jgi:hypothetical protein
METLIVIGLIVSAILWLGSYFKKEANPDSPCGGCSSKSCYSKCDSGLSEMTHHKPLS